MNLPARLQPTLHLFVAFDWGDEIDLTVAAQLAPAELGPLARRSRTPASVAYSPTPLRLRLDPIDLPLGGSTVSATAELTLFEIGAVSLALVVTADHTPEEWRRLAGTLAEPEAVVQAAHRALTPWFERLKAAIEAPAWSPLSEEYFVFQFEPGTLPEPRKLLHEHAAWLAALVRLEDEQLSDDEVTEALRHRIGYTPDDLFVPEWSAAVLVDRACEETLQTIEFANLQLLEFRHIDDRLDERLKLAARMVHPPVKSWRPAWGRIRQRLRELGELRIEAHDLYERTGNALKLVGDQYVARVYQMLATRFHLAEWQRSIERSLSVIEDAYQVLSDESDTNRGEILEWIVIVLIAFEVAMAFVRH